MQMRRERPTAEQLRVGQAAAWGPPTMQIEDWTRIRKNTLYGFLTVQLANGLRLFDCPVHLSHGKAWCGLPSKPQIDKSGRHMTDPTSGKAAYLPCCQWRDRDLRELWSRAVIKLLLEAHPNALDD